MSSTLAAVYILERNTSSGILQSWFRLFGDRQPAQSRPGLSSGECKGVNCKHTVFGSTKYSWHFWVVAPKSVIFACLDVFLQHALEETFSQNVLSLIFPLTIMVHLCRKEFLAIFGSPCLTNDYANYALAAFHLKIKNVTENISFLTSKLQGIPSLRWF